VPQERREILVTLMDALYEHETGVDGSARQEGVWEYAMATLLIERDWQAIRRAAAALKSEARLLRNGLMAQREPVCGSGIRPGRRIMGGPITAQVF
jgi:hypothetical protein